MTEQEQIWTEEERQLLRMLILQQIVIENTYDPNNNFELLRGMLQKAEGTDTTIISRQAR